MSSHRLDTVEVGGWTYSIIIFAWMVVCDLVSLLSFALLLALVSVTLLHQNLCSLLNCLALQIGFPGHVLFLSMPILVLLLLNWFPPLR